MTWTVMFDDNVEAWLDKLNKRQFKSVAKELTLLEMCGNSLSMPHSRPLGNGLFELRERKFGYRIYYTFKAQKIIVMLHAGNKKTQQRDISKAKQFIINLKELIS